MIHNKNNNSLKIQNNNNNNSYKIKINHKNYHKISRIIYRRVIMSN